MKFYEYFIYKNYYAIKVSTTQAYNVNLKYMKI